MRILLISVGVMLLAINSSAALAVAATSSPNVATWALEIAQTPSANTENTVNTVNTDTSLLTVVDKTATQQAAPNTVAEPKNEQDAAVSEVDTENVSQTPSVETSNAVPARVTPSLATPRSTVLPSGSEQAHPGMALGKIVISLALVILLVLGLGWLFKKLSLRLPGNRQIKIISALPLGQRERILVIEIQGKQRVIGVTPQSINLLFELENPLPEEKLASDFHTQLQSFLKK